MLNTVTRFLPLVVVPFFILSCGSARSAPPSAPTVVAVTPASPTASTPSAARATEVLMINGGGNASLNYRSHLLHLQNLHGLLVGSGVAESRTGRRWIGISVSTPG